MYYAVGKKMKFLPQGAYLTGVLEQCGNLAASDYQNREPLYYLNQLTVRILIFVHVVTCSFSFVYWIILQLHAYQLSVVVRVSADMMYALM